MPLGRAQQGWERLPAAALASHPHLCNAPPLDTVVPGAPPSLAADAGAASAGAAACSAAAAYTVYIEWLRNGVCIAAERFGASVPPPQPLPSAASASAPAADCQCAARDMVAIAVQWRARIGIAGPTPALVFVDSTDVSVAHPLR